ncbi:hypothetical protein HYW60_01575 [Candidatus Kaiserbacteria bacterium]|nr:hypothetical protein [Candidatus Kaiserbacteria bacterium]
MKMTGQVCAKQLGVHPRTFSDWRREEYSLPLPIFKKIIRKSGLSVTNVEIREPQWHLEEASVKGGFAHYKKYGSVSIDEDLRKERWRTWWESEGRFKQSNWFRTRPVRKPIPNTALAEFVGIVIGDGGITNRQVTITLNSETDHEYSQFVSGLVTRLFKVPVSKIMRKGDIAVRLTCSRTEMVRICIGIGLKKGNKLKQNLDIPLWIMRNPQYARACLRGLMDTDGCIFNECHNIRGKRYCYPRLSLVSASEQLRHSVKRILHEHGFSPTLRNARSVNLERREDIVRYFRKIGSNNLKHIRRFEQFTGGVG